MSIATRMRTLIEQKAQSDLSVAAFCEQHRISSAKYYYWKRRCLVDTVERDVAPSDGFTVLRCNDSSSRLGLELPGGLQLKFDIDQLPAIATLLLHMDRDYAEL